MLKFFAIFIVLVGCAAHQPSPSDTRSLTPDSYKDIVFPEFEYVAPYPGDYRISISDSITLYAVRDSALPLIDLTFYFKENATPKNKEEVAALQILSALYSRGGTEKLNPAQVDDSLEFLSARISVNIGTTQSKAHLNCLSRDLDKVLPLLREILNKPRLDSSRMELQKNTAIQSYKHRYDQPSAQATALSTKILYKDNPKLWRADSASIANIQRKDLLAIKDDFFMPHRVIIAAAGDFNKDSLVNTLTNFFSNWKEQVSVRGDFPPLEFNENPGVFVSEKDISQANIIMAAPFVKRPHPDYYQAAIANYILGGSSFSSRLMNTVRTQHGLAYSIFSFARSDYEDVATLGVVLQTKAESTKDALQIIREETIKLGAEGPSAEELEFAKKSLIESMPGMFESSAITANTFAVSELNGRSLEHYREYPKQIKAVTAEQVKAMAAKYFNPNTFKIGIVGPSEKMVLENIKLVPVEELDF
ncbi:MAG: insulinase family protein [Fibromonadaceae bacterium]|jgi:zinc protease|nr:insulinase family protein [Fibromonadaceae bacterium]